MTAEQSGGGEHLGYGSDGKPYFWIGTARSSRAPPTSPSRPTSASTVDGLLRRGPRRRRARQRGAGHPRPLPSQLLRRVRAGSRRTQHRSRLPRAGAEQLNPRAGCAARRARSSAGSAIISAQDRLQRARKARADPLSGSASSARLTRKMASQRAPGRRRALCR